jgi:hypothetical protein
MNRFRRISLSLCAVIALAGVAQSVRAEEAPAPAQKAELTDEQKQAFKNLDTAFDRFDQLLSQVKDVHEKAAVKAFLDALKQRRYDLRKNFDQALYDTLRLDVEIEYQRLAAWMSDPVPTRANRRIIKVPAANSGQTSDRRPAS